MISVRRLAAFGVAAALWVLPASPAPAAQGEDILSSEPGRMAPRPGEDALSTLPPAGPAGLPPAAPSLLPVTPKAPAGAGVEVLNGSGFGGQAAYWAARLRGQGVEVARVADADRLDHPRTVIYYAEGSEKAALEIRRLLGRRGRLQAGKPAGRHAVVVVLGRDLPVEAREETPGKD